MLLAEVDGLQQGQNVLIRSFYNINDTNGTGEIMFTLGGVHISECLQYERFHCTKPSWVMELLADGLKREGGHQQESRQAGRQTS